jgi:hypothetical protein
MHILVFHSWKYIHTWILASALTTIVAPPVLNYFQLLFHFHIFRVAVTSESDIWIYFLKGFCSLHLEEFACFLWESDARNRLIKAYGKYTLTIIWANIVHTMSVRLQKPMYKFKKVSRKYSSHNTTVKFGSSLLDWSKEEPLWWTCVLVSVGLLGCNAMWIYRQIPVFLEKHTVSILGMR